MSEPPQRRSRPLARASSPIIMQETAPEETPSTVSGLLLRAPLEASSVTLEHSKPTLHSSMSGIAIEPRRQLEQVEWAKMIAGPSTGPGATIETGEASPKMTSTDMASYALPSGTSVELPDVSQIMIPQLLRRLCDPAAGMTFDPGDYAWNWRSAGDPLKWTVLEPLTRRTQLLRAVYAKDPKQAVAGVLEQYDKPDFPPSLWKTVLLELEKLHGESFTLEATKSDNYSIREGIELEVKDGGGGAKSKTIGDFGTWSILWD